jgi:amino acid permease
MTDVLVEKISQDNLVGSLDNGDYEQETDEQRKSWIERYFSPLSSGSLRGSIISIAAMCFGPASLSFPIALTNVGLIPGSLMFFILTSISIWSINILLETGRKMKIMNYSKLIKECLGDKMLLISDINNMVFCFGIIMAYQFSISQFFMETVNVLFDIEIGNRTVKLIQMLSFTYLFQVPLSLLKDISKLQYASIVGSFALFYTIFVMAIQCPFYYEEGLAENRNIQLVKAIDWSIMDSYSIFLYGYASHNGILAIYSELKKPNERRSKKVLSRAMMLQIVIFVIVAYSGFFSLIEKTPSIFISRPTLKSLNGKDYYILVSKIFFFLSLNCTCAITYNILRGSINSFFFQGNHPSFLIGLSITAAIFTTSCLLTFLIDNVVKIVGILGGLCAVIVCYISPILCYVKSNGYSITSWRNIMSLSILALICVCGVMSTVKTIFDYFNSKK